MYNSGAVIVLGAYGLVGREVVKCLCASGLRVVAAGRRMERLETLAQSAGATRPELRIVNTSDAEVLAGAMRGAGLVINCVGPYALGGAAIAEAAIGAGAPYIDFANEQEHYNRLRAIDAEARRRGLFILTAAGLVPGISTLLMLKAAKKLPGANHMESFYAEGRRPDPEAGMGSIMSGMLEATMRPMAFEGGTQRPFTVGSMVKHETLPQPFGRTWMLALPGIDALIVPGLVRLETLHTWFGMVKPPPGFFALVRALRPDKRPGVYEFLRKLVFILNEAEHKKAVRKGIGPEGILKVSAWRGTERLCYCVAVPDGGAGASWLPCAAAMLWAKGGIDRVGLITPPDIFSADSFFASMAECGREISLSEENSWQISDLR